MIYIIVYIILGIIVSLVNWLYIIDKKTKDETSICIYLPGGVILWPAIVIGWVQKLIAFINKEYIK